MPFTHEKPPKLVRSSETSRLLRTDFDCEVYSQKSHVRLEREQSFRHVAKPDGHASGRDCLCDRVEPVNPDSGNGGHPVLFPESRGAHTRALLEQRGEVFRVLEVQPVGDFLDGGGRAA